MRIFEYGKSLKEPIDQSAHFLIGFLVAFFFGDVGAILVVIGAYVRELWQNKWYWADQYWGTGTWRDMSFWLLGALLGSML